MTLFLHASSFDTLAQEQTSAVNELQLSPVQQAVLEHISQIEDPAYRKLLIFGKIEKLLEESYREENLKFADDKFTPEAGKEYEVKDIVVTDSALILRRYAEIPDGVDSARLKVLNTGACLVGSVPYFWGGKASHRGWNARWGHDVIVSGGSLIAHVAEEGNQTLRSANADGSEVLIPYGLDCSGFVDWAYWTALGYRIGSSTRQIYANSNEISEEELLPGDLGFLCTPSDPSVNHVGLYVGKNKNGKKMWLHCSSTRGVCISQCNFIHYRRPNIDIYYKDEDKAKTKKK